MSSIWQSFLNGLPSILGETSDYSKEVGIIAISAFFHATARINQKAKGFSVPPVISSTIGVLVGLNVIAKVWGKTTIKKILKYFDPSVDFLGNWMSLWLVPPLILLPSAVRKIPNANIGMWVKLAVVHFGLFVLSNAGCAAIYKGVDMMVAEKVESPSGKKATNDEGTDGEKTAKTDDSDLLSDHIQEMEIDDIDLWLGESKEILDGSINGMSEAEINEKKKLGLVERSSLIFRRLNSGSDGAIFKTENGGDEEGESNGDADSNEKEDKSASSDSINEKQRKQMKLIRFWGIVAAGFYAASSQGLGGSSAALACTSITALSAGVAMPGKVKKVIHPLLLTAFISGLAVVLSEMAKGEGSNTHWTDALFKYTPDAKKLSASRGSSGGTGTSYSSDCTGQIRGLLPGQLFSLLLGPSCTALAFRIYAQQETVGKQLPAVLISSVVTAIASLFVSPAIGRIAGLPSQLNNILAHRSITSALAIPSATQTGASPELTVAAVLITGLYGASGGWLLDLFLSKPESGGTATTITVDATGAINQAMAANADMSVDQLNALRSIITSARGTVVGTTSHSIGTASLLSDDENKAAGIASVSMLIAGISHAIVASIPACTQWVQQIAGVEGA